MEKENFFQGEYIKFSDFLHEGITFFILLTFSRK